MPFMWRIMLIIYNLVILLIAGGALGVALGINEPLVYINAAFASPENRMLTGVIAVLIIVVTLFIMLMLLNKKRSAASVIVDSNLSGQVSITVPAIKVIIMKAVKKIDGIKDIRPVITNGPDGLLIYLHMMINPEHNVPEMSQSIQSIVKEYIEDIAGLQVAEIKILVDDFNAANGKRTGK